MLQMRRLLRDEIAEAEKRTRFRDAQPCFGAIASPTQKSICVSFSVPSRLKLYLKLSLDCDFRLYCVFCDWSASCTWGCNSVMKLLLTF